MRPASSGHLRNRYFPHSYPNLAPERTAVMAVGDGQVLLLLQRYPAGCRINAAALWSQAFFFKATPLTLFLRSNYRYLKRSSFACFIISVTHSNIKPHYNDKEETIIKYSGTLSVEPPSTFLFMSFFRRLSTLNKSVEMRLEPRRSKRRVSVGSRHRDARSQQDSRPEPAGLSHHEISTLGITFLENP